MQQTKRKVDKIFFGLLILSLGSIFFGLNVAKVVVLGVLIGFGSASLVFEKDIRKIEDENFKGMGVGLAVNLAIYAIALTLANFIDTNAFIVAAITLIAYRHTLIRNLKRAQ